MTGSPPVGWPTRATNGIVVHPIPLPGLLGLTLAGAAAATG